jgi:hypothetical protein
MWRVSAMIRPHASSAVGLGSPRVPHTVTPCSRAASMSIDALPIPVVTSSRRLAREASRFAVNGVRSRIATIASNSHRRSRSTPSLTMWSWKTVTSAASPSDSHGPYRRATSW